MSKINFLLACNKRNTPFILPFIWFAKETNPNVSFEIYITDGQIDANFKQGLKFIQEKSNNTILINLAKTNINPAQYRFLIDPIMIESDYTYIGDSDILICENIFDFHAKRLSEGYIYDNEIRYNTNRMSSLHFVKTNEWYKNTQFIRARFITRQTLYLNDEIMLYDICRLSGIKIRPMTENGITYFRPIHGQHISLSRIPFQKDSPMKVSFDLKYLYIFNKIIKSSDFKNLLKFCPEFTKIFNIYLSFVNYNQLVKENFNNLAI